MKLKQFGLLTAASLALVACSNESDPVMGGEDNAPKKVVLKLEGISQGTKSTDANTSNTSVTLNDVAIFLYSNGGTIYHSAEYSSSDEEWTDLTGETGVTFNDVDPAVKRVLVIGNYANLINNEAFGEVSSFVNSTVEVLSSKTLSLRYQNQAGTGTDQTTKANITLFGKTVDDIADSDGDGIYEAEVSIKPIVSRLEVSGVTCTFVEPVGNDGIQKSATVKVDGIGLFDYYNTMTLDGTALTDLMNADKIAEPGTGTGDGKTYEFLAASGDWTWAYDITTDTEKYNNTLKDESQSGSPIEMTKKPNGSVNFAYNFFPVATGTTIDGTSSVATNQALANIRLRVKVTDSEDSEKDYVVTTNFLDENGSDVIPEPGKIYKLKYAFETKNIRENWGDDRIKVNVIVTPEPWEIIPVTPSF